MKHKIAAGLLALILAASGAAAPFTGAVTVNAAETWSSGVGGISNVVTENGVASLGNGFARITVSGNNASQNLVGKKFRLYQLFDAMNASAMESINYTFTDTCKAALQTVVGARLGKEASKVTEYDVIDYIQSLNTHQVEGASTAQTPEGYYSDFRYFVEDLRDELAKYGDSTSCIVTVKDVKDDGTFDIQGMAYGYYVLDEVTDNDGDYSASSLCIVDTANPFASVAVKSDYPSVVKKIREDDNRDAVGNGGWNDMADYEIGQTVPYRFTSTLPDMNGYDTYTYRWHDVMDPALTFHPDSVKIVLTEGDKSYTLSESEFEVKTENVGEDTFTVTVPDIKEITDRIFDHKNAEKHNTYGQEVVLTYDATLNDNAAKDTGLPGFENKVRLEFSNDPDRSSRPDVTGEGKTGFTPWDPVVCFTYRLDGVKVNDHDKTLKGAKFSLYLDEDCTDEVYVKKDVADADGYVVIHDDSAAGGKPADAVEMVSDENGIFNIIGLDSGVYYLKENEAPAGYRAILDPIKLEITATFSENRNEYVEGTGKDGKALTALQFHTAYRQFLTGTYKETDTDLETDLATGTGNITIVNNVGSKLPVTGSGATVILLGAGCILMVTAGMVSRKKRKA